MSDSTKTELGIDENIEGALAYLLGFVTGILLVLIEKDNRFVRFHSIQSIAAFLPLYVVGSVLLVLTATPYVGWIFGILYSMLLLADFILWILLMFKAYRNETFKLPIIGNLAEKYANK